MQSTACGSPRPAPGQGQDSGRGGGECCARLGPAWEQPVHGPSIAWCHFVPEMLLAEQRGCSEVCVLTFSFGEECLVFLVEP